MLKLKELTKVEFETALRENNAEKLNYCNFLSKVLNIDDTSLEKIVKVKIIYS